MLLDEPLANLDYKLREELRAEIPRIFEAVGRDLRLCHHRARGGAAPGRQHRDALGRPGDAVRARRPRSTGSPQDATTARVFSDPPMNFLRVAQAAGAARLRRGAGDPGDGARSRALPDGRLPSRASAPTIVALDAPGGRRDARSTPPSTATEITGLGDLRPPRPRRRRAGSGLVPGRATRSSPGAGARLARPRPCLSSSREDGALVRARRLRDGGLTMAQITLDDLAHSYLADPAGRGRLRAQGAEPRLGGRRGLCAARRLGLRQDHAAQHHLGAAAAVAGAHPVRRRAT